MELELVENWKELSEEQKYEILAKCINEKKTLMLKVGDRYETAIMVGALDKYISWEFLKENIELFNKLFHELHIY